MKSLVVVFLFFHFLTYSSNHLADAKPLQIVNSTTYIKDDMNIFRLPYDNKWKLNEVRLIAAKPFDACGTIKNAEELVGSIAVTDKFGCLPTEKAHNLMKYNISAILIINNNFVAEFAFRRGWPNGVLGAELWYHDKKYLKELQSILEDESNVVIVNMEPDPSPWWILEQDGTFIFYRIFFVSWEVVLIAIASYKQFYFWKANKEISLPTVCLSLLTIALILRIPFDIDPLQTKQLINDDAWVLLVSVTFPFVMSTTMLIAFYWQFAISDVYKSKFLPSRRRFLIPVGIVCGILFSLELLRMLFLSVGTYTTSTVVGPAVFYVYMAVIFIMSVFYIISASRILHYLRNLQNSVTKSAAQKLTLCILISCCFFVILPLLFYFLFIPPSSSKSSLFATAFLSCFAYLSVQSGLILAFEPKKSNVMDSAELNTVPTKLSVVTSASVEST